MDIYTLIIHIMLLNSIDDSYAKTTTQYIQYPSEADCSAKLSEVRKLVAAPNHTFQAFCLKKQ